MPWSWCSGASLRAGVREARQITHAVWGSLHGLLTLHVANQLVHGCDLESLVRPTVYRILGHSHG